MPRNVVRRRLLPVLIVVGACGSPSEPPVPEESDPITPPTPIQFNVQASFISREPRLPPPTAADAPPTAGWPAVGETVTWVGHVRNHGAAVATGIRYRWLEDGTVIDSGVVDIGRDEVRIELPWTWTFQRHRIGLQLVVPDSLGDLSKQNDSLSVDSDALSVGFWVEQSTYDLLYQPGFPGFERWAHEEIGSWNRILARARFSTLTPDSVFDRLRLDRVTVMPDFDSYPNVVDTDFVWYFQHTFHDTRFLNSRSTDVIIGDQTIVLHELMHQRGLTDLYAYDVQHGSANGSNVGILDDGSRVVGTSLMPLVGGTVVFPSPIDGLMGFQYRHSAQLSEHSVHRLNQIAGRRTPRWKDQFGNHINGFANSVYVNELPTTTAIRFVDPITNLPYDSAEVDVFPDWGRAYQDIFLAEPDLTLRADANGIVRLPETIIDPTPTVTEITKSWVMIFRVRQGGARGYVFVPGADLNLLRFRGDSTEAATQYPVTLQ